MQRKPQQHPPRRPLWRLVSSQSTDGVLRDAWQIVRPGEPGYEDEYAYAAAGLEFGAEMPYADDAPPSP